MPASCPGTATVGECGWDGLRSSPGLKSHLHPSQLCDLLQVTQPFGASVFSSVKGDVDKSVNICDICNISIVNTIGYYVFAISH